MSLFVKNVFSNAVLEEMGKRCVITHLAYDATPLVSEIRNAGDKVSINTFKRTATVSEITKGTPLVPGSPDMDKVEATIKHVGTATRIFKVDSIEVQGEMKNAYVEDMADSMVEKMDTDLAVEMTTNATKVSPTASATAITFDEIMTGLKLYGDQIQYLLFKGIVINSRLYSDFIAMPQFTSVGLTYANDGNGIVQNNGLIGYLLGKIAVYVSDNGTFDSEKNECITFIIQDKGIAKVLQREVDVNEDYQPLLFATDVVADSLYAVRLINDDKIVVLRKTVA